MEILELVSIQFIFWWGWTQNMMGTRAQQTQELYIQKCPEDLATLKLL